MKKLNSINKIRISLAKYAKLYKSIVISSRKKFPSANRRKDKRKTIEKNRFARK
jgi:hypothetical protein